VETLQEFPPAVATSDTPIEHNVVEAATAPREETVIAKEPKELPVITADRSESSITMEPPQTPEAVQQPPGVQGIESRVDLTPVITDEEEVRFTGCLAGI